MDATESLKEIERLSRELQQKFNRQIAPYRNLFRIYSSLIGPAALTS